MALIYAFQDPSGDWHGDPDTLLLDPGPGKGTLTYLPVPGTPEADSPFAGQTLNVLFGVTDLDPAPVTYQLDDGGGRFPASWPVYTLLAAPLGSTPAPEPPGDGAARPLQEVCLTEGGRRYLLSLSQGDESDLHVDLTICDSAGEVQGELRGTASATDLPALVRAFDAAATAPAAVPAAPPHRAYSGPPASRSGSQWTADERARLRERYYEEQDYQRLGQEFGRSALAVHYQLHYLGLAARPPQPVPSKPKAPPTGPTYSEMRKKNPRSHERWTPDEERAVGARSAQGLTAEEISEEFGRSVSAIEVRLCQSGAQGPAADKARRTRMPASP